MRPLALFVLGACSFSHGTLSDAGGGVGDDAADADAQPIDAIDAQPDAFLSPAKVRSIDVVDAQVAGGPHTDFPLLVSISGTWLRSVANGGDVARDDGFDIFFTADEAGITPYVFEVESYDQENGTLVAWVKLPLAAATVLYMHYGDPANTTDQSTPTSVWTAGYELVVHMAGGGDSTAKNTVTGTLLLQADGQVGMARSFNGTTSTASAGSNPAIDNIFAGGGALSGWYFAETFGGGSYGRLFDKGEYALYLDNSNPDASNAISFFHLHTSGDNVAYWHFNDIPDPTGTWHHFVFVYDNDSSANTPVLYLDGASINALNSNQATGTMVSDDASALYIGERLGGDRGFDGILDELRFASTVQSAGWYLTEYRNQFDPAAFYVVSAPL